MSIHLLTEFLESDDFSLQTSAVHDFFDLTSVMLKDELRSSVYDTYTCQNHFKRV